MRKTEETDWKQFTKDFFLHQEDDIHDLLARQKNDDEALAEEDALFKVEDRDGAQKFTILDAWKSNESNFDFQDIEEGKPMEETNKLIGQEKRKMVKELTDNDYKINEGIIDTLFPALATKEEVMNDPNITPEDREMMIRFWENEEIDAQNPDMFDDAYNWVKGKLGKESKASEYNADGFYAMHFVNLAKAEEMADHYGYDLYQVVENCNPICLDQMKQDYESGVPPKAKEGGYGSGKNRHGFGHSKWMKEAEINDSVIDNPFIKEFDRLLRSNSEMDYND